RLGPGGGVPGRIANPGTDPLSEKTRDLPPAQGQEVLDRLGVPRDKPILLDVTPYTTSRDPLAALRAYRLVRRYLACRLVLAGWGAADNPQGTAVLAELREAASADPHVHPPLPPPGATLQLTAPHPPPP